MDRNDFPPFFNKWENQTYVRAYPTPEFYGIEDMSAENKTEFIKWYATLEGEKLDFKKEIVEYCQYCQSDIRILTGMSQIPENDDGHDKGKQYEHVRYETVSGFMI